MNPLRFLIASLMAVSMAGCCCGSNLVMDPCDPCGGMMMPRRSCGLSRLWPGNWGHRGCGCGCGASCGGCGDIMDCGCASGNCGGMDTGMYGMPSSGGCACGQTASSSQFPMNAPMSTPTYSSPSRSAPEQIPTSIPMPAETAPTPPTPATTNDSTTMIPPAPARQMQMQTVTYEEFQRLPGTVISGPGSTTATNSAPTGVQQASAVSQPFLLPPSPSPATTSTPRPNYSNRQAVWIPAK